MRKTEIRFYVDGDVFDEFLKTIPIELLGERNRFGRRKGTIWIGGNRGVAWFFGCTNLNQVYKLRKIVYPAILKDSKGNVWLDYYKALEIRETLDTKNNEEETMFLNQ